MSKECLICKNHYSQSGKCDENKNNCLMFDEEPRGKKIQTKLTFKLDTDSVAEIVKYNSKLIFDDNGKEFEMTVIKINWINLEKMTCNITAEYHENEKPYFEKKRMFKLID